MRLDTNGQCEPRVQATTADLHALHVMQPCVNPSLLASHRCWRAAIHKGPPERLRTRTIIASSNAAPSAQGTETQTSTAPYTYILPRQAIAMFASGAVLGPLCDGLHSQHDVLHYEHPSVQLQLDLYTLHWSFETCWWVPLLFGLAGLIVGVSVPLADSILRRQIAEQHAQLQALQMAISDKNRASSADRWPEPPEQSFLAAGTARELTWGTTLLCISLFVIQYGLSGVLEQPLLSQSIGSTAIPTMDTVLAGYALLHWCIFDKTPQGFGIAALTAVCGPLLEMGLTNGLGLYHYSHPAVLGVPTWIPWVYFCGGPAVGNLGRQVWQELAAECKRQGHSA